MAINRITHLSLKNRYCKCGRLMTTWKLNATKIIYVCTGCGEEKEKCGCYFVFVK